MMDAHAKSAGLQDALFDSDPTNLDENYIKWCNTPKAPHATAPTHEHRARRRASIGGMLFEHAQDRRLTRQKGVRHRSWEQRQSVADADHTPLQRQTPLAAHTSLETPGAKADSMQPPIVALPGLFASWGKGGPFVAGDVEQHQPPQPQALAEQELAIAVAAASEEPTEQTPTEVFSTGLSDPYCRWLLKMDTPGAKADFMQPPIVARSLVGLFAMWGDGGPVVAGDVEQQQPAQPSQALAEQELAAIAVAAASEEPTEQTPTVSLDTPGAKAG